MMLQASKMKSKSTSTIGIFKPRSFRRSAGGKAQKYGQCCQYPLLPLGLPNMRRPCLFMTLVELRICMSCFQKYNLWAEIFRAFLANTPRHHRMMRSEESHVLECISKSTSCTMFRPTLSRYINDIWGFPISLFDLLWGNKIIMLCPYNHQKTKNLTFRHGCVSFSGSQTTLNYTLILS